MRRVPFASLLLALAFVSGTARAQVRRSPIPARRVEAPPARKVLAGSVGATFTKSTVVLCDARPPVGNSLTLSSIGGYAGTPTVVFTSIPPGIVLSAPILMAAPMPPDQTLPFTVASSGAAEGVQVVVAHVTDIANGLDVTTFFNVSVSYAVLRPQASPLSLSLTVGGPAATVTLSVAPPFDCYSGPVTVTFSGLPAGVTASPATSLIASPAYAPVAVTLQAAAGAPSGTATVNAEFSTSWAPVHTVPITLTVAGVGPPPDFALGISPAVLAVAAGSSGTVTVSATGLNGFAGTVDVATPAIPGVTFTPSTLHVAAGASQSLNVAVAAGTAATTIPVTLTGTATDVSGSHTAAFSLQILPSPDFSLTTSPASLSIASGGTATLSVTANAIGGFTGTVNVTALPPAGLTVTPAAFSVSAGASQNVEVRVATGTPPGLLTLTFRGTASGVATPKNVSVPITVTNAPDFSLSVTPPALRVGAGSSTPLTALITPLFGFTGSATLDVSGLPAGASLVPARPTLTPGSPTSLLLTTSAGTAPGTYPLLFSATAGSVQRTTGVTLEVLPSEARFSVTVSPSSVLLSAGTPVAVSYTLTNLTGAPLTITSATFSARTQGGLTLDSREESVGLTLPPRGRVTYSGTVLARASDIAAAGSPPLLVFERLFRSGPDASGAVATAAASISAAPASSLVSTLSVTRVSLVYPISGTIVGRGDALRAQGLLLGTGSGPVVVGWFYDGLLVETSTVVLRNGTPTSVSTGVSLPTLVEGTHEISLAALSPNPLSSPRVAVVVESDVHALRLVSPPAGSVFLPGLSAPTFSWIPLPGIARYQVGLKRASEPERTRRWIDAGPADRIGLSARTVSELPEGDYEWVVRGSTGIDEKALSSLAGASARPATAADDGWTVTSTIGRFALGKLPAPPVDLDGKATSGAGGVKLSWKPVPGARYLLLLYDADGRRLDTSLLRDASASLGEKSAVSARASRWRVVALDSSGGPVAWTDLVPLPAGGAR